MMAFPLDYDGFLGVAAGITATKIREMFRKHFDIAMELNRVSQKTRFPVNNIDGRRMTATGLLIKLQNDVQAVILLTERGLPAQAMSVLRVAFEALVHLKLVHEDHNYWKRYRDSHELFREKVLQWEIEGKTGRRLSHEEKTRSRAALKEVRKTIKKRQITRLELLDLAKKADRLEAERQGRSVPEAGGELTCAYYTLHQLGNQPTHATPSAIEKHWTSNPEGFVTGFVQGPRTDGIGTIVATACGILASALHVVEQLFENVELPPDAAGLMRRLQSLLDEEHQDAIGPTC